ncbi:MAG: lamin tail domain-containing protein [Verrucomicrobiota bacterium]|nr:lamin tail domain-containing protein [Verrucomicrobiota bacterium]
MYNTPFRVHLTTGEPDAVIRYTTDYSEPTITNGKVYNEPLEVRRTMVLRAAVFKEGMLPSRVETHTYVYNLGKSVTSLPMLSLVTERSNLWGRTGIMETSPRNTTKRGIAWERPVSMELIYPETGETLHANAGLRVQGGAYIRGRYNPNSGPPAGKYSFRLYFRGDYGLGRLRYPFFPDLQVEDFNHIVLRAGMNDHTNPFIIDELVRRLAADMGQVSARGTFMNLYLNGKLQGYYNPTERIGSDFLNSWNGSDSEWDIVAQYGEVREGDTVMWNRLKSAMQKNLSVEVNYNEVGRLLNIDNFIDYIMLNVYANTGDWPHNNWRAARERVPGGKWRFIPWDAEWSFGNNGRSVTGNNLSSGPLAGGADIAVFYRALQKNPEFRMRFADRVQIHYFNGGALTDENVLSRFREMKEEMSGVLKNLNSSVESSWVPRRREIVMNQMASQKIQFSENVPQFSRNGGAVFSGYPLNLNSLEGDIYYTMDGSDPRKPGAVTETGKVVLSGNAEKWVLVPSVQNGGSKLNSTWRGSNEPFDDEGWESGVGGVGYDENNDYKPHIDIDVDTEMNGINQSVFVRIPFQIQASDLKGSNLLLLRMKYDDGFVAYLNGVRIARVNASLNPRWNAGASGQHDDASAVVWSVFDVSKYVSELQIGKNILAIHGLNSGLSSSDMLINAELSIGKRSGAEFAESAIKYDSPINLNKDITIRARSMTDGQWSALVEHQFQAGRVGTPLRFTEIMYNPLGGGEYEFVELHNSGDSEVSLGWYKLEGINFTFDGNAKIGPGQYIVLASADDPKAFNLRYPEVQVYGWYEGNLSNSGENLALFDSAWRKVISVNYNDGGAWPKLADGNGNSLELMNTLDDPSAASSWTSSLIKEGSPGKLGTSKVDPFLIINEVHLESSLDSDPDFVELRNIGQSQVDLTGWELRDNNGNKFNFPAGTKIEQAGLLGIWCGRGEGVGLRTNFGLGQSGDSVALFDLAGNRVDAVTFGRIQGSIIPTNDGWVLGKSTFGAPNQILPVASTTELVINEWMADPDEGDRDWIELYNPHATAPVLITGLHIRVDNAVGGLHRIATIPPKGHQRVWLDMKSGWNHLDLSLPNDNATITLITAEGVEFAVMNYSRQKPGVSEGLLPDGGSRRVKFTRGSTPGGANILPNYDGPLFNELLALSKTGSSDWIEIYNDTNKTISLDGVRLSKDLNGLNDWSFPIGSKVGKGSYLVVLCDGGAPASKTNTGFSLSAEGGGIYMLDPNGFVVDSVEYGFQIAGQSIGRILGEWQLLDELTPGTENSSKAILGDPFKLVINEWMANPDSESDWFELYNPSNFPVSLGGLSLTDDPTAVGRTKYIISDSTFISPRGWVRWIANGDTKSGSQYLNFSLRGSGELVRLYGSRRNPIDEIQIINQANGVSRGRLPDGAKNYVDFVDTPTPGASNYLPLLDIVFNEVLSHTDYPLEDAIELRNISASTIDLSGWLLSDSTGVGSQFKISEGTSISPGGYAVFYEGDFNQNGSGFSLNSAHGDTLYLSAVDANQEPTGYRVIQSIPPTANGVSVGIVATSQGMRFAPLAKRTFGNDAPNSLAAFRSGKGSENSLPIIGPIVINEIQYEGSSSVLGLSQAQLEYIELHNISNRTVPLFNPIEPLNTWRLSGGISVAFPSEINLPSNGYLLLVGFDPIINPSLESRFRDYYNVPREVELIGPLKGRLSNSGESISLLRPDNTQGIDQVDAGYVPYIPVERISYDNVSPWPSNANGSGLSLQRSSIFKFGDDPENWYSALPTAGRKNAEVTVDDLDADGMIDKWEITYGLNPSDASDAIGDADLDGVTNLNEFLTGTDPNNEEDRFAIQSINIFSEKIKITVRVSPSRRYAIETSGNVDKSWVYLADFTSENDQTTKIFETNASLDSVKFYRIRLLD